MRAFLFSVFLISGVVVSAQTATETHSLKEWDAIAFTAFEENDKNAQQLAEQFLEATLKEPPSLYQVNAYTLLGIIHKNKGRYVSSIEFYNEALSVAESIDDQGRISACYNNIGSVYQIQENYEKALLYFKKSLAIEESLHTPLQKSIRLYNIGEVYREMDSLTLALSNFNSSLIIEKKYKNNEGIVYALLGITDIYLKLNRPTDAQISLEEAKVYLKESNIETQILFDLRSGEVFQQLGEPDKALTQLRKAKQLSEQHDFRVHLMEIYKRESEVKAALDKRKSKNSNSPKTKSFNFWWLLLTSLVIPLGWVIRSRTRKGKPTGTGENPEPNETTEPVFTLNNSKGKSLFEIEASKILCFEANDNYVIIHFLDGESHAKHMERIALRKIEDLLEAIGVTFSRVHKSFLVNPEYVHEVNGKSQAYRLKIEHLEFEIPVSRKFDISVFQ